MPLPRSRPVSSYIGFACFALATPAPAASALAGTAALHVPTDYPTIQEAIDVDGDGRIAIEDRLAVVAAWGTPDTAADFDGDGLVDTDDLLTVLGAFGDTCE
ncbi:MAG: hypothetical protein MK116_10600 [Phycisphaerales bacterium]|nr:hypothetical protein [Phycisphaerales bacterium]